MEIKNMQVFNLKKAMDQIREAMAEWTVYLPQKSWWRLDEIEAGSPSWNEWVNGVPEKGLKPNESMQSAYNEIRHWYYKTKLFMRARYGLSDNDMNSVFQVFVGYDPMRGVHMMSIGPYFAKRAAWSQTKAHCDANNTPLRPDKLLELAESIQIPPELKGKQLTENPNYKLKRSILSVRSDMLNKTSYFTRRFGRITQEDFEAAIQKQLDTVLKNFGTILSVNDVEFTLKQCPASQVGVGLLQEEDDSGEATDEDKNKSRVNIKWDVNTFTADPSNPSVKQVLMDRPVMGSGSMLKISPSGLDKILQHYAQEGKWMDIYNMALQDAAKQRDITVEEASKLLGTERDFITRIFVPRLRKYKKDMEEKGDLRAEFLNIPSFTDRTLPPSRQGQQQTETLRFKTSQKSIMLYKLDILRAIGEIHTANPTKLSEHMNETRKKHKTKAAAVFTPEIVSQWVDQIKSEGQVIKKGKVIKVKSWATMLKEAETQFEAMEKNIELRDVGFDDALDAYRMASTYFLETKEEFIDPKTRAKINLVDPPNLFMREGEEIQVNSASLTKIRSKARKLGTEEEAKKALQAEIIKEIGDAGKKPMEEPTEVKPGQPGSTINKSDVPEPSLEDVPSPSQEPFNVTDVTGFPQETTPAEQPFEPSVTEVTENTDKEVANQPEALVGEDAEDAEDKKLDYKKLFGNTLNGLIGLARDLDSQGKEKSAEEIHQIIRKYQNKL